MKGNEKILVKLNTLLADELSAINQYIVYAEMCSNWGYGRLHVVITKRAIDEMKHAEKLISRILFLEEIPVISGLSKIKLSADIEEQFKNDLASESNAIKIYNESIRLAVETGDNGTAELLRSILLDEEKHLNWIETQLSQIKQLDLKVYLAEQQHENVK